MTEPIVSVKGISKKYSVGKTVVQPKKVKGFNRLIHPLRIFKGMGMPFLSSEEKDFWALKNITVDIDQGEKIGIIGRNGAGKSTLLKILSRLVYPTEGEAIIRGRVTSLLGVGTGFNGNMTGRENVYMDATLHGLTKREIDAKFDEIVEFSGVGKFIDTPVKFYSSGMYSRLAFSVSAHLDPDILMLDEVLAVGDMAFQQKCLKKVDGMTSGGRTVIFVSHNMGDIIKFCNRVVWLEEGQIVEIGDAMDVTAAYAKRMLQLQSSFHVNNDNRMSSVPPSDEEENGIHPEAPGAEIISFEIKDSEKNLKEVFFRNEEICIETKFKILREDIPIVVNVHVFREKVQVLTTHCDKLLKGDINSVWIGRTYIPSNFLNSGDFSFSVAIVTPARPKWRHVFLENIASIKVVEVYEPDSIFSGKYRGTVRPQLLWEYAKVIDN